MTLRGPWLQTPVQHTALATHDRPGRPVAAGDAPARRVEAARLKERLADAQTIQRAAVRRRALSLELSGGLALD